MLAAAVTQPRGVSLVSGCSSAKYSLPCRVSRRARNANANANATLACRASKHHPSSSSSNQQHVARGGRDQVQQVNLANVPGFLNEKAVPLAAFLTFAFPQYALAASESSVEQTTTGFAAVAVLLGSLYLTKASQVSKKRDPAPKPKINDGKRWFQRNRKLAKKVTYTSKEERKAGLVVTPRTAGVEGKTRYKTKISARGAAQKWAKRANPTTTKREGAPNFFAAPTELLKYKRGEAVVQGKGGAAAPSKPAPAKDPTPTPAEETAPAENAAE